MRTTKTWHIAAIIATYTCVGTHEGVAQSYPTKPVRILAASVGSSADYYARYIGQKLTAQWRKPVVIENRGAFVAARTAAKATPDGYTLFTGETASLANAPAIYDQLTYNPAKDFAPITLMAKAPLVAVAHPSVAANNLLELIAYARQNPKKINYGSGGNGTGAHLAAALFAQLTGVEIVQIQYKGAGPVMPALVAGEIHIAFLSLSTAMSQSKAGRIKAYAVTSNKRFPSLPNIPTGAEAGVPGLDMELWFGLLAPASTPAAIIAQLNREVVDILNLPATQTAFLAQGAETSPTTPIEFQRHILSEIAKSAKIIKGLGARVE